MGHKTGRKTDHKMGHKTDHKTSHDYGFDKSDNQSASLLTDTMDLFNFKTSLEDCRIHQHIAEAGWETRHHLGSSRRQLLTSGDWKGTFNDQVSLWTRLMMGLSDGAASEDSRAIKYR